MRPNHPVQKSARTALRFARLVSLIALTACDPSAVEEAAFEGGHAISTAEGLTSVESIPGRREVLSASMRAEIASSRPDLPQVERGPTPTDRLIAELAERPAGERVKIAFQMRRGGFDFKRLRKARDLDRAALIRERIDKIEPAQSAVEEALRRAGATDVRRHWLTNQIVATVDAGSVPRLRALPQVHTLAPVSDRVEPNLGYSGAATRDGMAAQDWLDAGYRGSFGARADDGEIRLGFIEASNFFASGHEGFQDWASDNDHSRVIKVDNCRNGVCAGSTATADNSHGTIVVSIAAGSIEQDQDPGVLDDEEQRKRSGMAPEAEIYYYNVASCADITAAIQTAVADGVDVINMSLWAWSKDCSNDYDGDCAGMNAAITNATDAGVVVVVAAGNEGHKTGSCTMTYPAWRPDVLAVGALDSTDELEDYSSLQMTGYSSQGGVPITTLGGVSSTFSGVSLSAPGNWDYYYTSAPTSYDTTRGTAQGTSLATPVIAGATALMRQRMHALGWASDDARAVLTNMLATGDAFEHNEADARETGASDLTGYGRVRLQGLAAGLSPPPDVPPDLNDGLPWETVSLEWGWRASHILEGEIYAFPVGDPGPESTTVNEFKWAVTWFPSDLNSTPDIVIDVYDTCPAGGGEVRVAQDWSYDLRKRIHLESGQINGKCLEMRVTGWAIPPGGITFYSADVHHSDPLPDPVSPGDTTYCDDETCMHGRGDCDGNADCNQGVCVDDVGAFYGWASNIDVCELPLWHTGFCTETAPCWPGEGDCDVNADCVEGATCSQNVGAAYGQPANWDVCQQDATVWNVCTPSDPCTLGRGDCDVDADCVVGLSCVDDIGANYGWGASVDVCQ